MCEEEISVEPRRLKPGAEKRLLGLLGFAARARRLICGADLCRDAVRRGIADLVLVSSDASANTLKRISDACKYYETELCLAGLDSAALSKQIGKTGQIAVIGVCDASFARGIRALFEEKPSPETPVQPSVTRTPSDKE